MIAIPTKSKKVQAFTTNVNTRTYDFRQVLLNGFNFSLRTYLMLT
jgi:hypothetical protein